MGQSRSQSRPDSLSNLKHSSSFILNNARWLALTFGSIIVSAWTILRFFTRPSTFDLLGQQVMAHQWLSADSVHGAVVGPTNHLIKLVFLYIPFDAVGGSPRFKLILMALLVNILTFIAIALLLEAIWRQFHPKVDRSFYLGILWLATISGSVYWIQFSNSRNLEVAGGLLLVYCCLRLLQNYTLSSLAIITAVSSIVFFADPLQLYMTAVPVAIFVALTWLVGGNTRKQWQYIAGLGGALLIGVVLSLVIKWSFKHALGVEFIATSSQAQGLSQLHLWVHGTIPAIKQLAHLYVGGTELSKPIEALNLLFVAATLVTTAWFAWKPVISRRLFTLIVGFGLIDLAAFISSGQALQGGTARYLVMTVSMFVLALGLVLNAKSKLRPLILGVIVGLIALNVLALAVGLVKNWNPGFTKDAHIASAISFIESRHYAYGYAAIDVAIPADYYSNFRVKLLTLGCSASKQIEPTSLFFYKSYFATTTKSPNQEVPLILNGDSITNYLDVCTSSDIAAQFGPPITIEKLSDGSTVMIYSSTRLSQALKLNQWARP